jgi:SynChlorMet cassette protein ScmD
MRNPDVVLSEEYDGWGVLFDPGTGAAVDLSPVGVIVWQHLDGKHSVEEIVAEIERSYAQVPESVGQDVDEFISALVTRGFVLRQ